MFWSEELQKLHGSWEMVYGEREGEPIPAPVARSARLVVTGDQYAARVGGETYKGTTHHLDPNRKPMSIDATAAEGPWRGRTLLGIYELDGCRLKICFARPGKDRPRDFASGDVLYVWEALTEVVRYRAPGAARNGSPAV